jgi:rhomboid-like protein
MKAKYMVILFAVFELFAGLGPFRGDGIAHFAHLGGALFGFLLILYWRKSGKLL